MARWLRFPFCILYPANPECKKGHRHVMARIGTRARFTCLYAGDDERSQTVRRSITLRLDCDKRLAVCNNGTLKLDFIGAIPSTV
jgi:hypothetical protein